jgi:hypothetical protein
MVLRERTHVITEGTDPQVLACLGHVWRLEDRTPAGYTPQQSLAYGDEFICEICQLCRAIRCDRTLGNHGMPEQRCLEARNHAVEHRFPNGAHVEVGG